MSIDEDIRLVTSDPDQVIELTVEVKEPYWGPYLRRFVECAAEEVRSGNEEVAVTELALEVIMDYCIS